jgi:hypothetical protein
MLKKIEKKKLTLDDVLLKLQEGDDIAAVTNADNVKGGIAVALHNNCHLAAVKAA